MARPKKVIDFDQLEKLCYLQCTKEEICFFFEMDEKTITARITEEYGFGFSEYYRQKAAGGKIAIRRKQYEVAMSGNVTMLIWWGKNNLGQRETMVHTGEEGSGPIMLAYKVEG